MRIIFVISFDCLLLLFFKQQHMDQRGIFTTLFDYRYFYNTSTNFVTQNFLTFAVFSILTNIYLYFGVTLINFQTCTYGESLGKGKSANHPPDHLNALNMSVEIGLSGVLHIRNEWVQKLKEESQTIK